MGSDIAALGINQAYYASRKIKFFQYGHKYDYYKIKNAVLRMSVSILLYLIQNHSFQ